MMEIYAEKQYVSALTDVINTDIHSHLFIQISLAVDSNFAVEISDKKLSCKGIIIDSDVKHTFSGGKGTHFFMLIDNTSSLAGKVKNKFLKGNAYYVLSDNEVGKIKEFEHISRYLGIEDEDYNILDERIREVIEIIDSCRSSEHSIRLLAEKVYLSESRLSHLFKENTGASLSSYLVFHKLQKAMYYILEGMSITEASLMAGFDSPSHFAATSKRLLGISASLIKKDSVFLKAPDCI